MQITFIILKKQPGNRPYLDNKILEIFSTVNLLGKILKKPPIAKNNLLMTNVM